MQGEFIKKNTCIPYIQYESQSLLFGGREVVFPLIVPFTGRGEPVVPMSIILCDTYMSDSTLPQGPQSSDGHVEGAEPTKGEQRYFPKPDPRFE